MNPVILKVNGRTVSAEVEPRTHLADFLRDSVRLTGTHLGCEHGVCGACTVLIDGRPVRSCITYAVACQDQHVTTVEGYDNDAVMRRLRAAFTHHHALQCGFCTPGMLATARDIVLRLPEADEARVRVELAGNLCRCTGYMGIVAAICDVLEQLKREPDAGIEQLREQMRLGVAIPPTPATTSGDVRALPAFSGKASAGVVVVGTPAGSRTTPVVTTDSASTRSLETAPEGLGRKGTRIDAQFDLPFGADAVWLFMGDLPAVAACLPGASVESQGADKVKGRIVVRFGPMAAAFSGSARLQRDDSTRTAVLRGAGQDSLSQSRAQGDITYRLEALSPQSTRVHVDMLYALQGPLAQFSRSGLVKDFVRRMVADFGQQVAARMGNGPAPASASSGLSLLTMLTRVVLNRLRGFFSRGG